ncbi:uncharacterized protein [Pyxicephalus adspersus]|uniref:uncharacterized protein n=1 Tax=Pyxicephalus adspersus TaxID=30357 RepID=UPI003B5B34FD
MPVKKSVTPASKMLDALVLKKKIKKNGNPGECAVLSSLLCYIISLDGSDATKAITGELPVKVLKNKVQSKTQDQPSSKKALRPTRFQLLQSKFLNTNHEPPKKKPKEVGKLIFKENKPTIPSTTTGSIVKKLDASKLKLNKDEKLENDLHFRTDKNQWNKITGKGRVKSILSKFAAAEEKENKNIKPTDTKNYTPKLRPKGTVIDILKEKFEQNATICSVKVVKPSLVPKKQTVKKEIPARIKHIKQAEDHVAHTTIMTATCLESPVLEQAELSEQTIHTFLPTSIITKVYTSEVLKPSSKEMNTGEQLFLNDKHNQVVCFNFSSSTIGNKQLGAEIKSKKGTAGQSNEKVTELTEKIHSGKQTPVKDKDQKNDSINKSGSNNLLDTIDKHSLVVVGHGEVQTDLQVEKGYYDNIDQVTKPSDTENTSNLNAYASRKDSTPINISDEDLKDGRETKEGKLDDDGQICNIVTSKRESGNNVEGLMHYNYGVETVLINKQKNNNDINRFLGSDKKEEISSTDNMLLCLESEGTKQTNVPISGRQNENSYMKSSDKQEGASNADNISIESESMNHLNLPTNEIQNDNRRTADNFDHIDKKVMPVALKDSIKLVPFKETERNISSKAINPTDFNNKISESPNRTPSQNDFISDKNKCRDGKELLESRFEKSCEFYEHKNQPKAIPSILTLADKATFTTEPCVPLEMAVEKEIKVHQSITEPPSFAKHSLAIEQKQKHLNSCATSKILKPNISPQETMDLVGSADLSCGGTSTFQIPLSHEYPEEMGSFSCVPKTTNIDSCNMLSNDKQPEGLVNQQLSVLVNAQKQSNEIHDHKLPVSDKNYLDSRKENLLPMTSETLFFENKESKDILASNGSNDHLNENIYATSSKEIIKYEAPSPSNHPLPNSTESPTRANIKGTEKSRKHSQGNAANGNVYAMSSQEVDKYEAPSPRNHHYDKGSVMSGEQKANNANIDIIKSNSQVDNLEKKNERSIPNSTRSPTKPIMKNKQESPKHSKANTANENVYGMSSEGIKKFEELSPSNHPCDKGSVISGVQKAINANLDDLKPCIDISEDKNKSSLLNSTGSPTKAIFKDKQESPMRSKENSANKNVNVKSSKERKKYEAPSPSNHPCDKGSVVSEVQKSKYSNIDILKPDSQVDIFEDKNATSKKENKKYEKLSPSKHPSEKGSGLSTVPKAKNANFDIIKSDSQADNLKEKNKGSLPDSTESPTKAINTDCSISAGRKVTSKYQIPSSRDLTNDQYSSTSHSSTKIIPNNDLSKYKVQSYKDTTISQQMFKPLVVRACDTFKHHT